MNLIVFVDREQNILSPFMIRDYKECLEYLNNLVENNTIIFDDKSGKLDHYFKSCKKMYFDKTKIDLSLPEFVRPVTNNNEYVASYGDMFDKIGFLDNDRVFLFGNEFIFSTLPYVEKVYLVRFNVLSLNKTKKKYFDLLYDPEFDLISGGVPYFTETERLNYSIYKNKKIKKHVSSKKKV